MGGGVGRLIPESGALRCIARVICSSEPQFLLPFRKRNCAKTLGVVRCSANTKDRSYSFHISDKKADCIKKKKKKQAAAQPYILRQSMEGELLFPPCLVLSPGFLSHYGLSLGPMGEEGKWLVLESRDLPRFCTSD